MIRFHREVRREVERLGATNIDIRHSDPHSVMYYTFDGCRHRATLANSPSDNNALKVKLADIRRDLGLSTRSKTMNDEHENQHAITENGDPIVEVEARSTESTTGSLEMAEQPFRETTARGQMAHYQSNKCLDFQFPREIVDCLPDGRLWRVERAGQDWMILPGGNARLYVEERKAGWAHITLGARIIAPDLPFFGLRPAEYLASGGHLLVRLLEPVENQVREPDATPELDATPEPPLSSTPKLSRIPPPEPVSTSEPILVAQKALTSEDDLRTLLGMIRRVESETPLRLVREGDRLLWLARIE